MGRRKIATEQQPDGGGSGTAPQETLQPTTAMETSPSEVPMALPVEQPNGEQKKLPAFRVGPLMTSKNESVRATVWENQAGSGENTYTVFNVVLEASFKDQQTGEWRQSRGLRSSQVPIAIYCLQKAFEFACSQRDPANQIPF